MAQKHLAIMQSQGSGHVRYTRRNKKSVDKPLVFKKHDPITRKHEEYKEVKKLRSIKAKLKKSA